MHRGFIIITIFEIGMRIRMLLFEIRKLFCVYVIEILESLLNLMFIG